MRVIAVTNPKGGVGKTTFSTNLAGYFAAQGQTVMLGDMDVQQSSLSWLKIRPDNLARITPWQPADALPSKASKGHMVLDTPAGLAGEALEQVLALASKIVIPLQPSIFDILATQDFLNLIAKQKHRCEVGVLGMRVHARSRSADQLANYVNQLGLPVIGYLRDTQNYIQLAAHGATIWDVAPSRVDKDLEQWEEVLRWIER